MTQAQTQKIEYAYFQRWEKCLHIVRNASFLPFLHFKMVAYEVGYEGSSQKIIFVSISHVISFCNYFKTI